MRKEEGGIERLSSQNRLDWEEERLLQEGVRAGAAMIRLHPAMQLRVLHAGSACEQGRVCFEEERRCQGCKCGGMVEARVVPLPAAWAPRDCARAAGKVGARGWAAHVRTGPKGLLALGRVDSRVE